MIHAKFTIANRTQLSYPMLIGRNVLKKGFLIDPNKNKEKPKDQREIAEFNTNDKEGEDRL